MSQNRGCQVIQIVVCVSHTNPNNFNAGHTGRTSLRVGVGSEQNPHVVIDHAGHEPSENGGDKTDTEGGAGSDVEPLDDALITLSTAPAKAPEKVPFFGQTMRKKESGEASSAAKAVLVGMTGEEDGAGSDGEPMAGWGVGSDDEVWGDDGDDGDGEETVINNSGMAEPVAEGSRIMKSTSMVTTRCRLAALLVQAAEEEDKDSHDGEMTLPSEDHLHSHRSRFSRVASYLQTLSASAVDVEPNTLCMGDFDDEGKTLLGLFLQSLEDEMTTRRLCGSETRGSSLLLG